MKHIGNVDVKGEVSGAFKEYENIPLDPKVGTWAFINKTLMMCIEVASKPLWIPLSPERNTVVRPQDTPSTVWIVDHNFDRDNVMMQCFDSENKVIVPDSIEPIDSNSSRVTFTEAISGSTIAMFGYEDGTSISSGEVNNNGGGGVPVSTITAFASKEAMLKFGTGYIGLDGQSIDYKSFPQLYLALGGVEGSEDLIKLPDANGQNAFFRGGRISAIGFDLIQDQSIKSHNHEVEAIDIFNPTASFITNDASGDSLVSSDNANEEVGIRQEGRYYTSYEGQTETRPINFSGYWAIKAFGSIVQEGELDAVSLIGRIQSLESELADSKNEVQVLKESNRSSNLSYLTSGTFILRGEMLGEDTVVYEDFNVVMARSGNAVSISGQLRVSGFSSKLDTDASCGIVIDLEKLGTTSGLFTSGDGEGFGTANFQFYEEGSNADCLSGAGYLTSNTSELYLRLLETISAKGDQRSDRCIIRFSGSFSVK